MTRFEKTLLYIISIAITSVLMAILAWGIRLIAGPLFAASTLTFCLIFSASVVINLGLGYLLYRYGLRQIEAVNGVESWLL